MFRFVPVIFVCLWATGFVGANLGMPHAEPATFLLLRFILVIFLLGLLAIFFGSAWPRGSAFFDALIIGVLIHGLYLGGVFWSVRHGMPGGISALIVGLQPLLTGIFALFFLSERVGRWHWHGVILGLVGLVLVLFPRFELYSGGINLATIFSSFVSVVAISLGTIYQKNRPSGDLLTGMVVQYLGAGIFCLLWASLFESFYVDWNIESIFALLWLVLVLSLGAVFLLLLMIRRGSVSRVSSLFYLVPCVTAMMTWVLFDERLLVIQIFGMLCCALAVWVATFGTEPEEEI